MFYRGGGTDRIFLSYGHRKDGWKEGWIERRMDGRKDGRLVLCMNNCLGRINSNPNSRRKAVRYTYCLCVLFVKMHFSLHVLSSFKSN